MSGSSELAMTVCKGFECPESRRIREHSASEGDWSQSVLLDITYFALSWNSFISASVESKGSRQI